MKRFETSLAAALTLGVALVFGCGGGGSGSSSTASPEAAAENSAGAAQDMGALKADKGSEAGLGAAMQLYGDLQALTATTQANQATAPLEGGDAQDSAGYGDLTAPLSADCLATDADGNATYTDCQVAGATFNGTVSGQGDDITLDITMDMPDPGSVAGVDSPVKSVKVTEKGTLTITEAMIKGTINIGIDMELDLSGQTGGVSIPGGFPTSITQNIAAVFDVTLTDGCVTGGTIQVTASGGMSTAGQQNMTATFSGCGDVAVQ